MRLGFKTVPEKAADNPQKKPVVRYQDVDNVRTVRGEETPMYVTWNDPSKDQGRSQALAFATHGQGLANSENGVQRTVATNIFQDIAPGNVSIREGFNRRDYEMFRPGEIVPKRQKDIIAACMSAYDRIGIIRQIIDLMADFATQGVEIVHPNPTIDKFYKNWFGKVEGISRSERFLNQFYRVGNVIVKRTMAQLSKKDAENIQKGIAGAGPAGGENMDVPETFKVEPRKIPMRYVFLNPLTIEVMEEELTPFVGEDGYMYALRISDTLSKKFGKAKNNAKLMSLIPSNIRQMLREGKKLIPLPSNQIEVYHYKKDDWQVWANPMVYPILSDLRMLEKMKLADLVALDGAVSHIRVWRLGSLEHHLLPTDHAVNRLATILLNNVGGGSMDLIWGPDLELQETSTDVHKFLGSQKYEPVLNAIYAGLGIPPTLTGSESKSGFTNNFISLRTLTERLNYGRQMLISFWQKEIKLVQQAFDFKQPAEIIFDRPALTDEAAELSLLIQLVDRNIVSAESVQDRFNFLPNVENIRLNREERSRRSGRLPPKASPYENPRPERDLKKIALQTGQATPSEVGLELEEKAAGEKNMLDKQADLTTKTTRLQNEGQQNENDHQFRTEKLQLKHGVHPAQIALKTGQVGKSGQGRPRGSKDGGVRKQKRVLPRSKAAEFIQYQAWTRDAQKTIAEIIHPVYLLAKGKKTLRSLTDEEADKLERFKFALLCQFQPNTVIDETVIVEATGKPLPVPEPILQLEKAAIDLFLREKQIEPSLDDVRQIQGGAYALWHVGVNTDNENEGEIDNG